MKLKILAGVSLVTLGLVVNVTFNEYDSKISSLEQSLYEQDQYVSELENKLKKQNMKLTEANKLVEELQIELKNTRAKNDQLENRLNNIMELEATAYTPFCNTGCIGITRSGHDVSNTKYIAGLRVVAVDPDLIPLGTTMTVHTKNNSFEAIALDTGSDIQGHRLDILFLRKDRAWKFGRQDVVVEITGHVDNYRSL